MKRTNHRAVATAPIQTRRLAKIARAIAASALSASAVFSAGGSTASAFGGYGERIVSSRVVSDVVVGESAAGANASSETGSGGCADGNCGGAGGAGGTGGASGGTGGAGGGYQGREYGQPDLFYNFYTQGGANSANAQMYISPVPVPPQVGHTFMTYQPFYPHEMLYKHTDRFHNYYDGGRGMNRTRASYSYPPVKTAVSNFYWNVLRLPR